MKFAWTRGIVSGEIDRHGHIIAKTRNLEVVDGKKPGTFEESGSDAGVFERLRARIPGPFETVAHFGGATAVLVPFGAIKQLSERGMKHLRAKFGPWDETNTLLMHVRNSGAPAVQNAAEPGGGMADSLQLDLDRAKEIVELGLYKNDGWVRFMLTGELAQYQAEFDEEQRRVWGIMNEKGKRPHIKQAGEAKLAFMNVGSDIFNEQHGVLSAGPVGDFAITRIAKLHLDDTNWGLIDCETGVSAKGDEIPLGRKMVATLRREFKAPVMLMLDENGGLDDKGLHVVIDGENRETAITHVAREVLIALGWLQ